MSDTPRTDEVGLAYVPANFARNLERELHAWRECATSLREILVSYPCYAPANQIDSALNRFNELNK